MKKNFWDVTVWAILASLLMLEMAAAQPTVIATINVSGNPLGLAINEATNRIYVGTSSGNNVAVIDGANNMVITTIAIGANPIGVAVNATTNLIYTANQGSNTVSVIDGASNMLITDIAVGNAPHGIAVNSATNRIYAGNRLDNSLSVIDGGTNLVIATISLPGSSVHSVAVNAATNRVYVTQTDSDFLVVLDGAMNTILNTIPTGAGPTGVSVNATTNRVYVGNVNSDDVAVIDGTLNAVIAGISIGDGPTGTAVNQTTNRIYVANGNNDAVSVIDGCNNTVIGNVMVNDQPIFVAVNSSTNRIYVPNIGANNVSVIADAPSPLITVAIDIKPGSFPNSINPRSKGVIPVAILTMACFDATTVDPLSVKFGPNGATEAHGRGHLEDADGDGDVDMVLHFKTQQTGIQCGETSASLIGKTVGGQDITGTDAIQTVGCTAKAVAEAEIGLPDGFALFQNYPNPFNPETEIRFQLSEASPVVVKIFNLSGEEIRTLANAAFEKGNHRLRWDGKDKRGNAVASGMYLYQLRASNFSQVRKMSLLR